MQRLLYASLWTVALATAAPLPAQDSPGGALVVSNRLVQALVARPIDERQHLAQCLMGTYTEGTIVTKGKLDVEFVPSLNSGVLELRLHGVATLADATGYSGPVTIRSSSRTTIDARKRISLTAAGLHCQPTEVHSSTQIDIHDIEARRRLIERIAWRRAGRMQASVEQAASRQAERRTADSMDRLVDRGLETGSDVLKDKLGPQFTPLDMASRLHISTTAGRFYAIMMPAAGRPLKISEQPAIDRCHDAAFVLHDALASDVAQTLLAGSTVHDDEFLGMMNLLVGSAPRPLWVHARQPRWSVTLARTEPLKVQFSRGQVRFRLGVDRIEIDGQQTHDPMIVEANYGLSASADGPVLTRRGPLHLLDQSDRTLTEPTPNQKFIERKVRGVLLPEIRLLGLIPPAGSNWEPLRGLEIKELTAEDGWLKLCYELSASAQRAPLPVSLGAQVEQ